MLILKRHVDQEIVVETPAGTMRIMVTGVVSGRAAYIGIDAPKGWRIMRAERMAACDTIPLT